MQRHVSLIVGLIITLGLVFWLVVAAKNGTLDLGATSELLQSR